MDSAGESDSTRGSINPFVSTLSVMNFFFAMAMNIFGYTVFYLLQSYNIPIIFGGIGTTIGQVILLVILIPQGRAIDRGFSYVLMIIGSLIYSSGMILLSLRFFPGLLQAYVISSAVIGAVLVTQNTYKSSLGSFIGKASKLSILGKHYSRIIMMETAGGTAAMFVVAAMKEFSHMYIVYLVSGVILLVVTVLTFFVLFPESRKLALKNEGATRRPTFRESLVLFRDKRRFVIPVLLTKIFMSVGVYGLSYFFILSGEKIGVIPEYSIILLGIGFAISIPSGIYSGKYVDRHPSTGKGYIILLGLFDIFFYGAILASIYLRNPYIFYGSISFNAFGPLFVSGAMSYEVKVIGKENRGMFSALQRTLVGITFILVGVPFAYLYSFDYRTIWIVVTATAILSVISAAFIPGTGKLVSPQAQEGTVQAAVAK
ncbi:MAG: MFS transporter [Thermoplasmataceae archaeon]